MMWPQCASTASMTCLTRAKCHRKNKIDVSIDGRWTQGGHSSQCNVSDGGRIRARIALQQAPLSPNGQTTDLFRQRLPVPSCGHHGGRLPKPVQFCAAWEGVHRSLAQCTCAMGGHHPQPGPVMPFGENVVLVPRQQQSQMVPMIGSPIQVLNQDQQLHRMRFEIQWLTSNVWDLVESSVKSLSPGSVARRLWQWLLLPTEAADQIPELTSIQSLAENAPVFDGECLPRASFVQSWRVFGSPCPCCFEWLYPTSIYLILMNHMFFHVFSTISFGNLHKSKGFFSGVKSQKTHPEVAAFLAG